MRLRALRKLEEIVIREEHSALSKEQKELKLLMKDEQRRWQVIGEQVRDIKARFGDKTPLGKRRTEIGDVPSEVVIPLEAVVEREPVTVLCPAKGWVRTLKIGRASCRERVGQYG